VHDLTTGGTTRVSVDSGGLEANRASEMPSISGDGNRVAFASLATNLVAGDGNGREDVFVRDLTAGTTVRASVDSSGGEADDASQFPELSYDGSRVVFDSIADDLVTNDSNGNCDVFLHALATGTTELVSCDSNGVGGDGGSDRPDVSADVRVVVVEGFATNLVPNDLDAAWDVFVRDLATGVNRW
jgi:Tol biopolymer transport system component